MKTQAHPYISIITITYNAGQFLESTIQSVISQTSTNYEYIIIDGGSRDKTLDIIKKYEEDINCWISEPDEGLYDAMNKGLTIAKGEFVWFLNAGDKIFANDTLEKIGKLDHKTDVFYSETMVIDEDGEDIGLRRLKPSDKLTWKDFKWGQLVCHQSFIARREIAEPYNLNYKCSADTDWQIRVLKKSRINTKTPFLLSQFLDGGKSKKTIIPSLRERFIIMIKNYGFFPTLINHFRIALLFLIYYTRNRRF